MSVQLHLSVMILLQTWTGIRRIIWQKIILEHYTVRAPLSLYQGHHLIFQLAFAEYICRHFEFFL